MYEDFLSPHRVIPVVILKSVKETYKALQSIRNTGINIAEIAFRTSCAADSIRQGRMDFPDMIIGAGTVITEEQCESAIDYGAMFIVSPGLSEEVAAICKRRNVPYFPGCVTPTEITKALKLGLNIVKFYPAKIYGGLRGMKALAGPFPTVKFIPTGGSDISNLKEYLAYDKVISVGGTWMMRGDVERNCREIMETLKYCDKRRY